MKKYKELYTSPDLQIFLLEQRDVMLASSNRNDGFAIGDGDTITDQWIIPM